jgi:hypothetical protein
MASGETFFRLMQCHCTPDDDRAKVCVGFAVKVGPQSFGYRLAGTFGMIDEVEDDGDLLDDIEQVIEKHNTSRRLTCK